jgi:hypothetical protein
MLGCGPTGQEKSLQASSQSFASTLQAQSQQLYGEQQGVLNAINASLSPILAAGPNQQGFSAAENANLQTSAINSAGAAARNAEQAVANYGAGQGGGGSSGLLSGVEKQIQAGVASQETNALAGQQNQIVAANYNQGNANYWRAAGGEQGLAQGYNPNGATSGANTANSDSFGEAGQIQKQNQQEAQAIGGLIETGVGAGLSGGASLAASPAGANQPLAFLQGFGQGLG